MSSAQPQPQLLSLLEKVANPLQKLTIKLKLNGIYAAPQQWKISDQANPNIFGYNLKVLGQDYTSGKIQPKKLTQKQLKQLQQKNKKGGKKQPKQQQKPPTQAQKQEQQRKQRQWNALSEQQRYHRTQQDPYKTFSLQFPQKNKQINYDKDTLQQLQTQINNDCIEITLTRKPEMSEQDLQKLKKSKPKTLNLGQLYPMVYKGIIRTKQLQRPGASQLKQRVKLTFGGNVPDDGIKIETDTCYAYIQIQCSQPITPQVKQITPKTQQIIPNFENPNNSSTTKSPIQKLKQQLCRSIRAISQQYILCFAKQKQHIQQKRHASSLLNQSPNQSLLSGMNININSISTLKLNEINKRKQQFINEFINTGKFNILKQRISKTLKLVIIDKFRKQKQNGPITKQQINQTLSHLNLYFQEEFIRVIDQFMNSDSGAIHEDLVLGYEHSKQYRKNIIAPIANQSQIQRQTRLAGEYDILEKDYQEQNIKNQDNTNRYKAQKHYINVLLLSNSSLQSKQNYAKFCLKAKKFNQAYILYKQISQESHQLSHKLIQAVLLVHRRRIQQATNLLSQMMESSQCQTVDKINYNLLLSFMYERQGDIKSSEKYLAVAQRYYKIKNNPHMKFTPPQNPYILPKPKIPKPQRYISQLSHKQSQQIRLNFITILSSLNLYNLVSEYLPKLEQSNKKTILQIQVDIFNRDYQKALGNIQGFLKKSDNIRNIQYLLIKADICYRADKMFECQEIFLQILQLKPPANKIIHIYLRLGYIYIARKSWQDAKQIFEKAVQNKYNCSVAWFGLGISNLYLGKYNQAQQALNLTKIYNPLSNQTQQFQQKINEHRRNQLKTQRNGKQSMESSINRNINDFEQIGLGKSSRRSVNDY